MDRLLSLTFLLTFIVPTAFAEDDYPLRSVAELRRLNPEGTGSVHENELVRVRGIATTEAQQFAPVSTQCGAPECPPGTGFYIDDGDGGLFIWSYLAAGNLSDVAIGTEVTVTGKVTTYRGRLQLTDYPDPNCAETLEPTPECPNESLTATAPALSIESQGNSVPEPVNVTLSELRSAGELLEGRLVALTGVYAADVRQNLPPPGVSRTFQLKDSSIGPDANPLPLYVGDTTDIGGQQWPNRSQCDLLAIADEFGSGGGSGEGRYRQLRARSWADFTNFRPRDDSLRPTEVTPIATLRPEEGGASPQEGQWVLVEGWLTSRPRTMAASWNSGVGFSLQDDSGGLFVISGSTDYIWEPASEDGECQGDGECGQAELCSPNARCQVYRDPGSLTLGDRIQVMGQITTVNGRLTLADASVDEPLVITVVLEGDDLQRVLQPVVLTVDEFLQGGEQYEGVLIRVDGLHLADANQTLPLGGRSGEFRLRDEADQLSLDVRVERNACQVDQDGLRVCVNQDGVELPPDGYSGGREWDEFQFDLIGIGDEYASGAASGLARIVPRAPDDFVPGSFRNWSRSDNSGSGEGTVAQPPPPPPVEGCGCHGASGVSWIFGLLAMGWLRRRRQ